MTTEVSFIKLPEICRLLACSKSTIYQRERDDPTFPKKLKLSPRASVWRADEVTAYIEARTAEARGTK